MSGRRVTLPKGAKLDEHGKLVMPDKKPSDVSAKIRQRKSKRVKVVSPAQVRSLNKIGKSL